jgi:hypothetical protein
MASGQSLLRVRAVGINPCDVAVVTRRFGCEMLKPSVRRFGSDRFDTITVKEVGGRWAVCDARCHPPDYCRTPFRLVTDKRDRSNDEAGCGRARNAVGQQSSRRARSRPLPSPQARWRRSRDSWSRSLILLGPGPAKSWSTWASRARLRPGGHWQLGSAIARGAGRRPPGDVARVGERGG